MRGANGSLSVRVGLTPPTTLSCAMIVLVYLRSPEHRKPNRALPLCDGDFQHPGRLFVDQQVGRGSSMPQNRATSGT